MGNAGSATDCAGVVGIRLAATACGVRYPDRLDLVLMELGTESTVSGVFTRNAFCAAPVSVARHNLRAASARYFLINSGNANAGTGRQGEEAARHSCCELARLAGVSPEQVLPFSTGVIGEPLPVENIIAGLPDLLDALHARAWPEAATGIMTTDTRPKLASRQLNLDGKKVAVTGMAKGAGMIRPDMATMLAYVCTDLAVAKADLDALLLEAVKNSFNRITVDGDTSTNDSCMLVATGESGASLAGLSVAEQQLFVNTLDSVFRELATELIRDAEGATKFVTVTVCEGQDSRECLQVAWTIAESPLVKTALFAADPNWGRILAAVGRSGVDALDITRVAICLGDVLVAEAGCVAPTWSESLGQQAMAGDEITITVRLGRGTASETVWTSDLSHDYVRINADYRT